MPETISTKPIYQGSIFEVRTDTIRDGEIEYERDIIAHPGSGVIVPVFEDGTVALVRQYRHAAGKSLLELPAGSLDNGESPETGARRELEQEIGVTAETFEQIAAFYVSPGFLTEKMYVYLATGLTETSQSLDDDEIVEIERISFERAFEMIKNGEIEDAKTIVGLTIAGTRFGHSL